MSLLLLAQPCAGTAAAVPLEALFRPSATDAAITQFNDRHFAVVDPAVASRGRLVLFLPGTGANPFLYREFPRNAASLGFHALGLMYPKTARSMCCASKTRRWIPRPQATPGWR